MTPEPCPSRRTVRRRRAMPPTPKKKPRTTPSHPKDSKWYATKAEDRVRRLMAFPVDDKVRERLKKASKATGKSMATIVEEALLAYLPPE